ncbi:hypothetical protein ACFC1T_09325 [Kitasatospora sp. NPDC056076]|uniref:hypothetical protein n=1 Tax=Kitasatospora sp. NPDC056076 TaxID=3345703 RepID=UPI0035E3BA9C
MYEYEVKPGLPDVAALRQALKLLEIPLDPQMLELDDLGEEETRLRLLSVLSTYATFYWRAQEVAVDADDELIDRAIGLAHNQLTLPQLDRRLALHTSYSLIITNLAWAGVALNSSDPYNRGVPGAAARIIQPLVHLLGMLSQAAYEQPTTMLEDFGQTLVELDGADIVRELTELRDAAVMLRERLIATPGG